MSQAQLVMRKTQLTSIIGHYKVCALIAKPKLQNQRLLCLTSTPTSESRM